MASTTDGAMTLKTRFLHLLKSINTVYKNQSIMNQPTTKPCLMRHLLFIAALFIATAASAQTWEVKGTVTDATGEPLIGASVIVKGTSQGVSTDIDGQYTLQARQDATITRWLN